MKSPLKDIGVADIEKLLHSDDKVMDDCDTYTRTFFTLKAHGPEH